MIIIDGQEVLEEEKIKNNENNIKNDQEIQKNIKNNINKIKKTPIKQFIVKLFEMFCEILLIIFIYSTFKNYYKIYKYGTNGSYIYYEDIVFNILFIAICFSTFYTNLYNLFKYEDDYKFFGKFKKLYQKIQEFDRKLTYSNQNEKKLKEDELNDNKKEEIEVKLVNSIYPLVSNIFNFNTKNKSNSQLIRNIFFPRIKRRRHYYSNNEEELSKFENFIMKLAIFLPIIFMLVFIGFLMYIRYKKNRS